MTIHEFGTENKDTVVLIHPSVVMWDYFEYVIPLLEKKYHLIVPAIPGYDPDEKNDFTSVEEIASELAKWLKEKNLKDIACLYGCSMGGSIVIRMLADNALDIRSAVIDGGITPYRLPWIVTRFIAIKDFLLIGAGKLGGVKLLEKAFSTDELSPEDIQYTAGVLKMISAKTIWRTFESCNNYSMPKDIRTDCRHIEYWVADKEIKDRKADIAYVKEHFPETIFMKIKDTGHGGLAPFQPEKFVKGIERAVRPVT
ncbi:MAG: alpha/beta hydrolase [Lachnospiraceae bacterium]|nr:alpha/beta hydrolase [Lachnospiraceae bacterium]